MAGVLKIYVATDYDPDFIFNSFLFGDENEILLLAAVSCFMRRSRNRINGFMRETVPLYSRNFLFFSSKEYARRLEISPTGSF